MEKFVLIDDVNLELNCSICSRNKVYECSESSGFCHGCFLELIDRLHKYEEVAFLAEERIKENPLLSKLYDKLTN